jgi:O-antigen/teichoic acid export membrane protein
MSVAVAIGYNQKQIFLLLILGLNQFLLAFILFVRSAFSGLQQYKTDSFLSVLDRVIMIAICGYLLWGRNNDTDFRIEWFVYAQSAAYLITSVFSVFLLFSQTKFITPAFDIKEMKQMLKQSLPYASLVLFMMLTYRLDAVMIERILPEGKAQAGLYAQGFRLFDAFNMIAFLFAGLLLPMFASLFAKKQNIKELADVAFSLLFIQ